MVKRFYKEAILAPSGEGFEIHLDGRAVKTPGRVLLHLPTEELATQIAAEWQGQEDELDPLTMPLTRLAYGALDRTDKERAELVEDVVKYAGSDLLCYRAESPQDLQERQKEVWQPLLDWAKRDLGVGLNSTSGIMAVTQPESSLLRVREHVAGLDQFRLAGLHPSVPLLGSAVLGLALLFGRLDAKGAEDAAFLDEVWQEEQWGQDLEALEKRQRSAREIDAIDRFLRALTP